MELYSDYFSRDELLTNNFHSYTNNTNRLINFNRFIYYGIISLFVLSNLFILLVIYKIIII
jgi:hypothetical protein